MATEHPIPSEGSLIKIGDNRWIMQGKPYISDSPVGKYRHIEQKYSPTEHVKRDIRMFGDTIHESKITFSLPPEEGSLLSDGETFTTYAYEPSVDGEPLFMIDVKHPYMHNSSHIASLFQQSDGTIYATLIPQPDAYTADLSELPKDTEGLRQLVHGLIHDVMDDETLMGHIQSGNYRPYFGFETHMSDLSDDHKSAVQELHRQTIAKLFPELEGQENEIAQRALISSILMGVGGLSLYVEALQRREMSIDEEYGERGVLIGLIQSLKNAKAALPNPGIALKLIGDKIMLYSYESPHGIGHFENESVAGEAKEEEEKEPEPIGEADYGKDIPVPDSPYVYTLSRADDGLHIAMRKGVVPQYNLSIALPKWETVLEYFMDFTSDFAAVLDTIPVTFSSPQGTISTADL